MPLALTSVVEAEPPHLAVELTSVGIWGAQPAV